MHSIRVSEALGNLENFDLEGRLIDWIKLNSEDRSSPHLRVESTNALEVLISLDRGQELDDGDILFANDEYVVAVKAADEDLFLVAPETNLLWGIAGYQLGNLHRPIRFQDDAMLTPFDPLVASLLESLEIPHKRANMPFVGRRYGAHTGHSHLH